MKRTHRTKFDYATTEARRLAQWIFVLILYGTGALAWARRSLRKQKAILVLTFHRVLPDETETNSLPGMVARKSAFAALSKYLAGGYRIVRVEDAQVGSESTQLPVAYTFDDGWMECYDTVLPIARECRIPFTVFLCPNLMGTVEPFWPELVVKKKRAGKGSTATAELEEIIQNLKSKPSDVRLGMLAEFGVGQEAQRTAGPDQTISWDNAREMAKSGIVAFGSHTARHEILTTIRLDVARTELEEGRFGVEQALGTPCLTLAYPNGDWNPEIARLARDTGYQRAFTTERRAWTSDSDPFAIPRCNIAQADIVGPLGNFSRAMFLYTSIWKAYRATPGQRPAAGDLS